MTLARMLGLSLLPITGGLGIHGASLSLDREKSGPAPNVRTSPAKTFPQAGWERRQPADLGLNSKRLAEFSTMVGGHGCIIRNGYLVHEWGNPEVSRDWGSASKPVLGTLLLMAVQNRLLPSVHTRVRSTGWQLEGKDSAMTFLQLANMTSGYSCAEPPGTAWAYNDYGIQLLARSLERVYQRPLNSASQVHLAPLNLEDGTVFGSREGLRAVLSPRDMARLGWFWLNQGSWDGERLVARKLFTKKRPRRRACSVLTFGGSGH